MNLLYALFFALILSCSESSSSAGGTATETETSISAVVRDGESISSQAKVYLYEIDKLSLQEKLVDSMYTDENGRFSFPTEKGSLHRVEVTKGNFRANYDAVSSKNSQVKEIYLRSTFVVEGLIKEWAGAQIYTLGGVPVTLNELGLFTLTNVASGNNILVLEKEGNRAIIPLLFQSTRDTLCLYDLKIGDNKYEFGASYPLLEIEEYNTLPLHYYSKNFEGVFYLGKTSEIQNPTQAFYTLVVDSNYAKSLMGDTYQKDFPPIMSNILNRASGYLQAIPSLTQKFSFRLKQKVVWLNEITNESLLASKIEGDYLILNPYQASLSQAERRISINLDLQNHTEIQKADSLAKLFIYEFSLDRGAYPRKQIAAKTPVAPYGLAVNDFHVDGAAIFFFEVMFDYKQDRFHDWTLSLLNESDSATSRNHWIKSYPEKRVQHIDISSRRGEGFQVEVFARAIGSQTMTSLERNSYTGINAVIDVPELINEKGDLKWEMLVVRIFAHGYSSWHELYLGELLGSCWVTEEGCRNGVTGLITTRPELVFE